MNSKHFIQDLKRAIVNEVRQMISEDRLTRDQVNELVNGLDPENDYPKILSHLKSDLDDFKKLVQDMANAFYSGNSTTVDDKIFKRHYLTYALGDEYKKLADDVRLLTADYKNQELDSSMEFNKERMLKFDPRVNRSASDIAWIRRFWPQRPKYSGSTINQAQVVKTVIGYKRPAVNQWTGKKDFFPGESNQMVGMWVWDGSDWVLYLMKDKIDKI